MNTIARARLFATLIGMVSVLAMAASLPRLRAEWVYGAARGYGSSPLEDRPGRLEAYAEAEGLDPLEFVYPFRRGQILLGRVRAGRGQPNDVTAEQLNAAVVALRRAAQVQPLDPRVRATLAEALLRQRDADGAAEQAEHAVRLGPRHPEVLVRAVDLHLRLWRGRRDVASLRRALEISQQADRLGSQYPADAAARRVAQDGWRALPDVMQATEDDPELRAFFAERLRGVDAAFAKALQPREDRP